MDNADKYSRKPDDFVFVPINEKDAISLVIAALEGSETEDSDFNAFNNIEYDDEKLNNWYKYTGCYCLTNILLKELEIESIGKPGEIDILLIPFNGTKIFYEKTTALEVKIAKPSAGKFRKGANSDGFSQTMGLVKLGFPYVGLLHIVVSVPLPVELKPDIPFLKRPVNSGEINTGPWPDLNDSEIIKWDWLPFFAQRNQMKRMLTYDIPKYVGLKSITLNFATDGAYGFGYTEDFRSFESGCLNPHLSKDIICRIQNYHEQNLSTFKKIIFRREWMKKFK